MNIMNFGIVALLGGLSALFQLVLFGFIIFFIIKTVKFYDSKISMDREISHKIDKLIESSSKKENDVEKY